MHLFTGLYNKNALIPPKFEYFIDKMPTNKAQNHTVYVWSLDDQSLMGGL